MIRNKNNLEVVSLILKSPLINKIKKEQSARVYMLPLPPLITPAKINKQIQTIKNHLLIELISVQTNATNARVMSVKISWLKAKFVIAYKILVSPPLPTANKVYEMILRTIGIKPIKSIFLKFALTKFDNSSRRRCNCCGSLTFKRN